MKQKSYDMLYSVDSWYYYITFYDNLQWKYNSRQYIWIVHSLSEAKWQLKDELGT